MSNRQQILIEQHIAMIKANGWTCHKRGGKYRILNADGVLIGAKYSLIAAYQEAERRTKK